MEKHSLKSEHIEAVNKILAKGDRVELIPVKDGVKVIKIKREEVNPNGNR